MITLPPFMRILYVKDTTHEMDLSTRLDTVLAGPDFLLEKTGLKLHHPRGGALASGPGSDEVYTGRRFVACIIFPIPGVALPA